MVKINMDMIQTIGLAVILLLIGIKLRKKIKFFEKYCIPAPVIGGFLFSIFVFILRQTNAAEIKFTDTLQKFFMVMFFTSVGFNASLKVLKKGGKKVLIFLFVAAGLCILQNAVAVGLSKFVGLPPLLALMTGSTPMTGGHGTSATFGPTLENFGAVGAEVVALASATYGLIAGCLIGGPIARRLLNKHNLKPTNSTVENSDILEEDKKMITEDSFFKAVIIIGISMGIGSVIYPYIDGFLKSISDGKMGLPAYIASMLIAAIFRNITDKIIRKKLN